MIQRHWKLIFAGVFAAAAALTLFDVNRRLGDSSSETRESLVRAMPLDAAAVFYLDLQQFRQSPFAVEFYNWLPKAHADAEYAEFLRGTGFDLERDLKQVALAALSDGTNNSVFLAIAEGRFDRKRIEAYALHIGGRENRAGREIFSIPLSNAREICFAFLSTTRVALTNAADLTALLDAPHNHSDAREWALRFDRLAGSPLVAVIRQSSTTSSALVSQAPGGFQSPQLSALLAQLQWITIAGKPQDLALRVVIEGEEPNDQAARQLSDVLNGILVMAQTGLNGPETRQQLDPTARDAYLELARTAEVSRLDRGETKSVRLVLDITPKLLDLARRGVPIKPVSTVGPQPQPSKRTRASNPKSRKE